MAKTKSKSKNTSHHTHTRTHSRRTHTHTTARHTITKPISKSKSKSKAKSRSNPTKTNHSKTSHHTSKKTTRPHTVVRERSRTSATSSRHPSRRPPSIHPTSHRPASARHPSSSLGPGFADPLLVIFLVVLALSLIALLVVGIWLLAARDGWPHALNHTGNRHYTRLISYGTACVIAGLLLIPLIIFIVLAAGARRGSGARINRLFAIFLASFIFIIFLLMIITGIMFASDGPQFISDIVRDAWSHSLLDDSTVGRVCDIQARFNCQGWYDNQCRNCRPTVNNIFDYNVAPGSSCTPLEREFCPRCFNAVGTGVGTQVPQGPQGAPPANDNSGTAPPPVADPNADPNANTGTNTGTGFQRTVVSAMDTVARLSKKVKHSADRALSLSLPRSVRSEVAGCRYYVLRRNRTFFIPMTVYLIFLSIILLFLSWKTCIDSSGRK